MRAVGGRLGGYMSTVSGPFHPFGGAVDIIVVEQPDGSFKSSPWYVRFGKFQGVLKTKEKVVSISVNGVESDFHMYLDHRGGAFFMKEVDVEGVDSVCSPPSSSGEDADPQPGNRLPLKSKICNYERNGNGMALTRTGSRRARILGLVFGRRSVNKEGIEEENKSGVVRTDSLERAEIAADLLELNWSTNLAPARCKKDNASRFSGVDIQKNENLEVDGCNYDETEIIEENGVEMKCLNSEYVVETAMTVECVREETILSNSLGLAKSDFHVNSVNIVSEIAKSDLKIQDSMDKINGSCSPESSNDSCSPVKEQTNVGQDEVKEIGSYVGPQISNCDYVPPCTLGSRISDEEQLLFGNLDDFSYIDGKLLEIIRDDKKAEYLFKSGVADGVNESGREKRCPGFSLDQSVINDYIHDDGLQKRRLRTVSSDGCINKTGNVKSKELTRMVRSLPDMRPLSNNIGAGDLGHFSDPLLYPGVGSDANNDNLLPGAQTMAEDVKILMESKDGPANPFIGDSHKSIDSLKGSGRSWPFSFSKSRSMNISHLDMNGSENPNVTKSTGDLESGKDVSGVKLNKKIVKILTPTSEQLASLNLKEGKNTVIFTFSTAMLGKQQVDARIFLWKWDTRIVISDVDGTITRSDLLGQVMPWVGMDWSQGGVAHLFSAIKDNGYQLLFLSARAISQSFHTRQFLFNIKQDGKALPDGPVVISPDGLFPSLFREVVRRAPHEFKIACLGDIKALFPADTNPFYAGFGNRDTDEFSYLKVGIPKGKIFIINPKGEIVVNRRVDTKSYSSLHTLVHSMFPTMPSSQKEDFNSWNYWRLPTPTLDL